MSPSRAPLSRATWRAEGLLAQLDVEGLDAGDFDDAYEELLRLAGEWAIELRHRGAPKS